MEIKVGIVNKFATAAGAPVIVCGNSDYTINFTFDDEWDEVSAKTARFVYVQDGAVRYEDVVFTGHIVPVPILSNTKEVLVGVFAENLHTTSPARIPCEPSIRCGTGAPAAPTPDQYDQIMELINTSGLVGPAGDSAYEIAVQNGFEGTEAEWLESLKGSGGGLDVDYSSDYTGQFLGLIVSSEDTTKCEVVPRNIQGSRLKLGDDGFELTPITGPLWFARQVKDSLTLMDVEVMDKGALNEINGGDAFTDSAETSDIATSIKWACLGDSITDLRTNRPNNYPYWIKYRNPSMTVQNLGIGGALMCFDRDNYLSDGSPVNSIYTQAQSIDADVDIITVFGGVNDYNWSVPLGTFPNDLTNFMDGFDTTTKVDTSEGHDGIPAGTFYQGCYRLAQYLRTTFPDKPIVWFTPMTFGVGNTEGKDVENHNDNNIYEFMDAVKKVTAYFSIPCYDLGRLCSITPRIQEMQDLYYFDNLHPNAAGSLIISRSIEREMKKVLSEWGVNI